MNAITFDTLKFTRKLESKGFTKEQAEGVAEAFAEAASDELATKADLANLERNIDVKLAELRAELRAEIKLNRWMLGIVIAAVALPLIRDFLL